MRHGEGSGHVWENGLLSTGTGRADAVAHVIAVDGATAKIRERKGADSPWARHFLKRFFDSLCFWFPVFYDDHPQPGNVYKLFLEAGKDDVLRASHGSAEVYATLKLVLPLSARITGPEGIPTSNNANNAKASH